MKLRISRQELEDLTLEQKQNLRDLWIPHPYDVAIATVCVDAALEKFEQFIYVIGGVKLLKHNDILLTDIKYMPDVKLSMDNSSSDNDETEASSDVIDEDIEDETFEDFSFDEDFSFEFQRPETFSKQDCVPLLDIGQMIDILERRNFGQGDFYLSAAIGDNICDMGKSDFSSNYSYDQNSSNCELCDVLWESVKALL